VSIHFSLAIFNDKGDRTLNNKINEIGTLFFFFSAENHIQGFAMLDNCSTPKLHPSPRNKFNDPNNTVA
jgi:hypothetical protein